MARDVFGEGNLRENPSRIPEKIFGIPFTVIKHVKMAKGKAKIVCSILIVSAKILKCNNIFMSFILYCYTVLLKKRYTHFKLDRI